MAKTLPTSSYNSEDFGLVKKKYFASNNEDYFFEDHMSYLFSGLFQRLCRILFR